MKKNKKLIFIELNELNLDLVKKYSNKYKFKFFNNYFFEKLHFSNSECDYNMLEPWIQWVSVHTGMTAKEHEVFRLGDIVKKDFEQIFEKVENLGFSVGAISPMNTINKMKKPKYFISDPWTNGGDDKNYLHIALSKAISRTVNSNSQNKIILKDYLILIVALLRYARFKNYLKYIYFFFSSLKKKWLKVFFLDLFLNDLHQNLLKKFKTDFSCIFFNAGAHIQHHYFFNSEFNNNFKNPPWYCSPKEDPLKEIILFYDEILFEYSNNKNYEMLIATGLSQEPYDRKKYYYRLNDHNAFLNECKIIYKKVFPRMTRDFEVEFNNSDDCFVASEKIKKINLLNNKKIFDIDNRGKSLFLTLLISEEIKTTDFLILDVNKKIKIIDHVSFVALKNGMHSSRGYVYSTNKNIVINSKDLDHVKKLNDVIYNFFKYTN